MPEAKKPEWMQFDALSVPTVMAKADEGEMYIFLSPREPEPGIVVKLPAGAVGSMIAQVRAEHPKIALKGDEGSVAMAPMRLTGARPFGTSDGAPLLLLQFDDVFELAVNTSRKNARILAAVIERALGPSDDPPKPH